MKKKASQFLKRYLWFLDIFYGLIVWRRSYIHSTGWVQSIKRGYPCDKNGAELPWMNYSVINILNERLSNDLTLFEYGSGYSTLFFAKKVKSVVSVEYDQRWFDNMEAKKPANVELVFREKDKDGIYCRTITEYEQKFDVVIVDGRDRVNCVKQSLSRLTERGVIILDDSSRGRYLKAIDFAKEKGFRALCLDGLKPTGYHVDRTTILYRDNNCLNL